MKIKRTEQGWPGHFVAALKCEFRRNTLLEYGETKIIVSTVGRMRDKEGYRQEIGSKRHYETMAFMAELTRGRFWDADVSKPFHFDSNSEISQWDAEDKANNMHEAVVEEIMGKLKNET